MKTPQVLARLQGIAVSLFLTAVATSSFAGPYNQDFNDLVEALHQSQFSDKDIHEFENPFIGRRHFILSSSKAPWAGNYFSMQQGGIANRWQVKQHARPDETFPTADQVAKMTLQQIDRLSPAEKYDIYVGDYNFSVTKHELLRRGPYRPNPPQNWEGFCNGVRCAGYSLSEPQGPVDVKNPEGVTIRFQPSDLKALAGASYFYADKYSDIGSPSRNGQKAANPPDAAVFDIALRYYLANKQKAFVVDTHLGSEIWNESVVGFQRTLSELEVLTAEEQLKYPEAQRKVRVKTDLYTLGEIGINESNRPTKDEVAQGKLHTVLPLEYILMIDKDRKAIGGEWVTTASLRGVDFAWFSDGRGMDAHYVDDGREENKSRSGNKNLRFEVLKELFKKSKSRPRTCQSLF